MYIHTRGDTTLATHTEIDTTDCRVTSLALFHLNRCIGIIHFALFFFLFFYRSRVPVVLDGLGKFHYGNLFAST